MENNTAPITHRLVRTKGNNTQEVLNKYMAHTCARMYTHTHMHSIITKVLYEDWRQAELGESLQVPGCWQDA